MNFKLIILLILATACGVKGDPTAPKTERLPSLLENYPDINLQKPLEETKKLQR